MGLRYAGLGRLAAPMVVISNVTAVRRRACCGTEEMAKKRILRGVSATNYIRRFYEYVYATVVDE